MHALEYRELRDPELARARRTGREPASNPLRKSILHINGRRNVLQAKPLHPRSESERRLQLLRAREQRQGRPSASAHGSLRQKMKTLTVNEASPSLSIISRERAKAASRTCARVEGRPLQYKKDLKGKPKQTRSLTYLLGTRKRMKVRCRKRY